MGHKFHPLEARFPTIDVARQSKLESPANSAVSRRRDLVLFPPPEQLSDQFPDHDGRIRILDSWRLVANPERIPINSPFAYSLLAYELVHHGASIVMTA